jgi:hypothetical protein
MLTQELRHDFQQDFGIEVRPDLSMQPDRGACVDEVGDLHDMLLLALWIRGHEAFIFQIELDFLPWLAEFQRPGFAATVLGDTSRLTQGLPDRCLGARQAQTSRFE